MHPCQNCVFARRKRSKFFRLINWCRLYKRTVERKCIDFIEMK